VLTNNDHPALTHLISDTLSTASITAVLGVAATDVDRDTRELVLADGRQVPCERLLLATGATACRLPPPGVDAIRYLRSFTNAFSCVTN